MGEISNSIWKLLYYGSKHLKDILKNGTFQSPFRVCIDVTNRCNLTCQGCYWRKDRKNRELSDGEWEKRLDQLLKAHPSMLQAVWLGGEPMLRFNLIKKLSKRFYFNQVITNGTVPLEKLPNIKYTVSVDGTREYYKKRRGDKYNLVKKNITNAPLEFLDILFLITRINKDNLEEFIKEWSEIPKVRKIIFSFYVPNINEDEKLWLSFKERDKIIDKLGKLTLSFLKIKEPVKHLQCLHSDNIQKTIKSCWRSHNHKDIHLDSKGKKKWVNMAMQRGRKFTCGTPNVDCHRCGADPLARARYLSKNRRKQIMRLSKNLFKYNFL